MPDPSSDLTGAKLLLVDDTPANLKVLGDLLEAEGYDLALASDGPLALKIAQRLRPELILLDVMMPGMDGYEVCRRLQADAELASIPVIFITAKDQTEDLVTGFEVGGLDYITKPFRDVEVLVRVQTQIRLHRMSAQIQAQNRALEEASRLKSDYLARMSHDLRTPMNAIIGYTRILLRHARDDLAPRQYRNLENIRLCADNLLELLNDILDLAKIESGHLDLHLEPVDLHPLMQGCLATIEPLVKSGVEVRSELMDIGPVLTDADRLRRVLMNLLGNAVKFTETGSITLVLACRDSAVELSVEDTGVGIGAEELPHIFDEFRQVKSADPGKPEGSGLGLAIARKSVELLGGTIAVESQVGVGTRFGVRLPLTEAA